MVGTFRMLFGACIQSSPPNYKLGVLQQNIPDVLIFTVIKTFFLNFAWNSGAPALEGTTQPTPWLCHWHC